MSKKMTGYESEIPRESFACETNATGSLRTLCHQIKTIIPYLITGRYINQSNTIAIGKSIKIATRYIKQCFFNL